MVDDARVRLSAAYALGTGEALAAWAATGRPGVLLLRDFVDGTWDPAPAPGVFGRDLVDNTSALVAAIAETEPEAFLEVFEDERYRTNSSVLVGLGHIDDPRATRRLADAAGSSDQWVRMDVAVGLGRRESSIASAALAGFLNDREVLVRHYALESLARIGDASALTALRAFEPGSPREAELAGQAIRSILERTAG